MPARAALLSLLLACCQAAQAVEPDPAERTPAYWIESGQRALAAARALQPGRPERARNVILFLGDGMSITTITAARIFEGQRKGQSGEQNRLAFEELPYVALARTYATDLQVSDSAPTMSAIMTGVKTGDSMISVSGAVRQKEPDAKVVGAGATTSLLELAEGAGLATGIVTTARLTHATPAACYAHSSYREWEADSDLPSGATVPDIASQLIDRYGKGGIGDGLEVALGGGRAKFAPRSLRDPEYPDRRGARNDARDLTREWKRKFRGDYVFDRAGFDAVDPARTTHLLGLFEPSHLNYETDRAADKAGEPSLAEMTAKAIDIVARNPRGYFLMVEGGRIDFGHHAGNAYRALNDAVALSDAVRVALSKLNLDETLVIVTSDHSHAFTMSGYPKRGNPILGNVVEPGSDTPALALDGKPYTTLGYANGLGSFEHVPGDAVYEHAAQTGRIGDTGQIDTTDPDYHQQALVPLEEEAHSGEDVAIFAAGPAAQLIHGVQEQSYTFYVMRAALGL